MSRPRREYNAIVVFAGWFRLHSINTRFVRRFVAFFVTTSSGISAASSSVIALA
ncbi:hypothetical protein I6J71_26575 [Amycolatopsis sp. FDAARGOS 1241]|nr:hypothetical protein [Amycolatopsis sp. FDAARGOS 1241]QRP43006.1 hypothetical protein I6J71_26575 [Amycolatopsis sp. FDAARGOS 1241]